MGYYGDRISETKLYYLYMLADGDISYSEEKIFEKICEENGVISVERNIIIENFETETKKNSDMFDVLIKEKLDEKIPNVCFVDAVKDALARIIWNLVNIGYADGLYSEEEKRIVKYLVNKWNIPEELYLEFTDVADTMLALEKQRKWIHETFEGKELDNKEKEIDLCIKELLEEVKISINELIF